MANATKLYETLEKITDDQTQWNQEVWAEAVTTEDVPPVAGECGTSFCLAGWAVVNEGIKLRWQRERMSDGLDGKPRYKWFTDYTEDGRLISSAAQEILQLDDLDMFSASNSLARLWDMAETETGGKIKRPANAPEGSGYEDDDDPCDCDMCTDGRW